MSAERTRRHGSALAWLRAFTFAAIAVAALRATPFYPQAAVPIGALGAGALALFAPGVAVIGIVAAVGVPLLAGDLVVGALVLLLGFGLTRYLAGDGARAFLVIALVIVAASVREEWAVVALAGVLLGSSEGAGAAVMACIALEGAGLLLGQERLGLTFTGGSTPIIDLAALPADGLSFGWLAEAVKQAQPAETFKALAAARNWPVLVAQPIAWGAAAAAAGMIRRPPGDRKRPSVMLAAAAVGVVLAAVGSGMADSFGGVPVPPAALFFAAATSVALALATTAIAEWVFPPQPPQAVPRPESEPGIRSEDADVDELLRMIANAEDTLATKHTVSTTVMITDMKSFSKLTEEAGSYASAKLVQRHRDLLLPVISRHGGRGKSTGGDGLVAAFEDPAHAVQAGAEIQSALAAYNTTHPDEPQLAVRVGIASGEVVLDKGGRPFIGNALNLAARVMALGDGGQVLVSGEVAELAGDAVPMVEHGAFALKNIAKPVPVREILWHADQEPMPPRAPAA